MVPPIVPAATSNTISGGGGVCVLPSPPRSDDDSPPPQFAYAAAGSRKDMESSPQQFEEMLLSTQKRELFIRNWCERMKRILNMRRYMDNNNRGGGSGSGVNAFAASGPFCNSSMESLIDQSWVQMIQLEMRKLLFNLSIKNGGSVLLSKNEEGILARFYEESILLSGAKNCYL